MLRRSIKQLHTLACHMHHITLWHRKTKICLVSWMHLVQDVISAGVYLTLLMDNTFHCNCIVLDETLHAIIPFHMIKCLINLNGFVIWLAYYRFVDRKMLGCKIWILGFWVIRFWDVIGHICDIKLLWQHFTVQVILELPLQQLCFNMKSFSCLLNDSLEKVSCGNLGINSTVSLRG